MALTLDSQYLRKLERFEIVPLGLYRAGQIGHRRSPSRGTGLEFADHKEYAAGDDIRYLDPSGNCIPGTFVATASSEACLACTMEVPRVSLAWFSSVLGVRRCHKRSRRHILGIAGWGTLRVPPGGTRQRLCPRPSPHGHKNGSGI